MDKLEGKRYEKLLVAISENEGKVMAYLAEKQRLQTLHIEPIDAELEKLKRERVGLDTKLENMKDKKRSADKKRVKGDTASDLPGPSTSKASSSTVTISTGDVSITGNDNQTNTVTLSDTDSDDKDPASEMIGDEPIKKIFHLHPPHKDQK